MSAPGLDVSPDATQIRAGEELDAEAVLAFVTRHHQEIGLSSAPDAIEVLQFPGGRANLTYLVRVGGLELVLRRPPAGKVGVGAHDMGREYQALSRLWRVYDRAPRAFCFCEDPSLIGAPFFIMERRRGVVIRYEIPPQMREHANVERRVSLALVDAIVDLHRVDHDGAGLGSLGRAEGFLQRQLAGWNKRWMSCSRADVPDFGRLAAWLGEHVPQVSRVGLIHNDPKLDNCQFDARDPDRVTAMFDWDMCTIGPCLIDLGTLLAYWTEAQCQARGEAVSPLSIFAKPGFPTRLEIAEYYASRSGSELGDIAWYEAFALWKSAVVAQQIHTRYVTGQTRDPRFARIGERVPEMLAIGLQRARAMQRAVPPAVLT